MQGKNVIEFEHWIVPNSLMEYFQSIYTIDSSTLTSTSYQSNWPIYSTDELVEKITCIKIKSIPDITGLVELFVKQYYANYHHFAADKMSLEEYHASHRNDTMTEIRSMIMYYTDEIEDRTRMVSAYFSMLTDIQSSEESEAQNSRRMQNMEKSGKIERRIDALGKNLLTLEENIDTVFASIELEMFPQTIGNRIRQLVRDLLKSRRP